MLIASLIRCSGYLGTSSCCARSSSASLRRRRGWPVARTARARRRAVYGPHYVARPQRFHYVVRLANGIPRTATAKAKARHARPEWPDGARRRWSTAHPTATAHATARRQTVLRRRIASSCPVRVRARAPRCAQAHGPAPPTRHSRSPRCVARARCSGWHSSASTR